MARPVWTPRDDGDSAALAAVGTAAEVADLAEAALWEAAAAARDRGVPVDLIAAHAGRGRSTVYRHLGEAGEVAGGA